MKDYERLRKALSQLLHTLRYWNLADRFYLTEVIKEAEKALAEIPETSEMERLVRIIKVLEAEERMSSHALYGIGDDDGSRDCTMRANGMGKILDVVTTEFGYGGEDAES